MPTRIETIEQYLESQPAPVQRRLEELRALIKAAAPDATEGISYGVPGFRLSAGRLRRREEAHWLLRHGPCCHRNLRSRPHHYKTSKGSISLPMDGPLPVDLIANIVKARVATNEAKRKK